MEQRVNNTPSASLHRIVSSLRPRPIRVAQLPRVGLFLRVEAPLAIIVIVGVSLRLEPGLEGVGAVRMSVSLRLCNSSHLVAAVRTNRGRHRRLYLLLCILG